MTEETVALKTPSAALTARIVAWVREFVQFGLVGALAFVIDAGLFNLFQHGPLGFLAGHPNTANVPWTYTPSATDKTAQKIQGDHVGCRHSRLQSSHDLTGSF